MLRFLSLVLCVAITAPASAQLHPEDSLAVVQTVARFRDTTALFGMLARGAVILKRGEATPLSGEGLQAEIRWARATTRGPAKVTARVFGWGAYVYSSTTVEAKANADLIRGIEVESVVLSRLGRTWFIELIHSSLGSPD